MKLPKLIEFILLFVLSIFMMFVSAFLIGITYVVLDNDGWIFVIAIMGWLFMRSIYGIFASILYFLNLNQGGTKK